MENDYIDFKFDDHWASEFNLVAVSNGDRYNPPIYGSVNSNTTTVMGKKGVYKWESQVNEKVFTFSIAFDSVTIAQLNDIKKWLEPHKVAKLILSEEPYKYYWVALNDEVDFSHLPFIENEKMVGDRKVIEGVYKGEITISFICVANDGYSEEGNYEGVESDPELKTVKGNNFVLTDADDDNIEDIKLEGHSEQEVKLNNDLTDTDFEDADNTWEVNNLATFSAENEEISVNAPYEFSGIAQEQRESIIGHKYYASAEVNTDSLDTALEIAGKNITNSKSGQTIEIDDGLIGKVDDLRVEGNSQQETKYNNEINSSFLEDLNNWDTINDGTVTRNKQEATITAQHQFDGITQDMEESNIGDKYYISGKVEANDTAVLEVETQTGTAQGERIELTDSADREIQEFKLYGKSEQESYNETVLGENTSIIYNNNTNYNRYTKVEVTGNTEQETAEGNDATIVEINDFTVLNNIADEDTDIRVNGKTTQEVTIESGTTIEGENLTVSGITNTNKKLIIKGQTIQETRNESGTTVTGENITVNDVTLTTKKLGISGNNEQETRSQIAGVTIENEVIRATDVELENGRVRISGNSKQETVVGDDGITVEGESIHVNDVNSNKVNILKIAGNKKQITTTGANKFPTATSGTDTTQYYTMLYGGTYLQTNTQYTIKVKGKPGDKYRTATGQYGVCTSNVVFTIGSDGIGTATFTTKESYAGVTGYAILQNYSANNTLPLTEITIAEGTEPTYEPYTGGQPSPNPTYKQDIYAVGDNINELQLNENTFNFGNLTVKVNSNDIFINGTPSNSDFNQTIATTTIVNSGNYILSQNKSSSNSDIRLIYKVNNGSLISGDSTPTMTLNKGDVVTTNLRISTTNQITNFTMKPKLEKGTTATAWSPYNMGNVNVVKCNKNIYNYYNAVVINTVGVATSNRETNSITLNGTGGWSNLGIFFKIQNKNQDYSISADFLSDLSRTVGFTVYGTDKPNTANLTFIFSKSDNINVGQSKNINKSFNFGNYEYMLIRFWNNYTGTSLSSNMGLYISNIQLEINSTTTTYTPHEEEVFNMPCQQPMPGQEDYFDWDNELEVHGWKKKIFDGTEEWLGSDNVYYIISIIDREYSTTKQLGISNKFTWKGNFNSLNTAKTNLNHGELGMISTSASSIYFKDTDIQTVADWKAYLAQQYANGTPVIIWYKLAEQEKLNFTQAQRTVADQIKNMQLYDGQTNIYSTDEVSPNFELNYNRVWTSPGINAPSTINSVGQNKLPNEYQQVEYIESTGTQYIDTGFIPTQNTKIEMDYTSTKTVEDAYGFPIGCANLAGGNPGIYFYMGSIDNIVKWRFGKKTNASDTNFVVNNDDRYIYELSNGKLKIGQNEFTDTFTWENQTMSLTIFARKNDGTNITYSGLAKGKLHYMKIYDNNALVRNFIPCKNASDVIGLYDLVTKQFYGNSGTGTFIAGNVVTIPNLDYLQEIYNVGGNIGVKIQNKNLFDKNDILVGLIDDVTGNLTYNTQYRASNYIDIHNLSNIYISSNMIAGRWGAFYNQNKQYISPIAGYNTSYSVPNNAYYIRVTCSNDYTDETQINSMQIEKGSTATTYTPHEEQTFALSCQQPMRKVNTIKDAFIKKADGNWYERHWIRELRLKVSDMNNSDTYPGWQHQSQLAQDFPNINNLLSSVTSYTTNISNDDSAFGFDSLNNVTGVLLLRQQYFNLTQTQWKTSYPDLIFQLQYVAPAPTDLLCTAEQTEVLEQLNNCTLYVPGTNISSEDEVAPLVNLRYNYVPAMPSIEAPSEIEVVGDDINLFDKDNEPIFIDNGAIVEQIDTGVRVKLTNVSDGVKMARYLVKDLTGYEGKTITISTTVNPSSSQKAKLIVGTCNVSGGNRNTLLNGQTVTSKEKVVDSIIVPSTLDNNNKYLYINLYGATESGVVTDSYVDFESIKIQQGTVATPYSEYGQGNVDVVICNENLLDLGSDTITTNGVTVIYDKNYIKVNGTPTQNYFSIRRTKNIILNPGTYTLYRENISTTARLVFTLTFEDNSTKTYYFSNGQVRYYTFIATKKVEKIAMYSDMNSTSTALNFEDHIQLVKGTTMTSFVPNESETFNIPCQKPMLEEDYFDFAREEEVHVWKKLILTGTESWTKSSNQTVDRFLLGRNGMMPDVAPISNYFIGRVYRIAADIGTIKNNNGGQLAVDFSQYGETSLEDFKTWLINRNNEGNPVIVYYKLANNEQLSLTATQKEVANQIRNAQAYLGTTNIYSENKVSPIFNLKYNYLSQLPSVESPSEIKNVGNDINLFDKDNANVIYGYLGIYNNERRILGYAGNAVVYIETPKNQTITIKKHQGVGRISLATSIDEPYLNMPVNNYKELGATQGTYTIPEGEKYLIAFIEGTSDTNAGYTLEDILSNLKIQEGSIATSYSSYGMGTVSVVKCNKNIKDFATISYVSGNNATITRTNGEYTVVSPNIYGSAWFKQSALKLKPNTTYTFSAKIKSTTLAEGSSVFVHGDINNTGNNIWGTKVTAGNISSITFTTPSTVPNTTNSYIGLYPRGSGTAVFENIQLEINNTTTDYTPHEEEIFNFPLAINQKLLNGSYLTETGIMHKRRQIILNGTENWITQRNTDPYVYRLEITDYLREPNLICACNNFKGITNGDYGSLNYNECTFRYSSTDTNKAFYICSFIRGSANFKAWLAAQYAAGTPVIVEYELENEIKDTYTAAQLAAYKQIKASELYSDTSNLYSINSTAPLLNLTYNYVPESPSVDKESRIRTVGENINLFDGVWESGIYDSTSGIKTANSSYIRSANYIPVKKLTNYIFSTSLTSLFSIVFYEYDENYNYLLSNYRLVNIGTSFTTGKQTKYITFRTAEICTNISTPLKLEEANNSSIYSIYNKSNIDIIVSNKNLFNINGKFSTNYKGDTVSYGTITIGGNDLTTTCNVAAYHPLGQKIYVGAGNTISIAVKIKSINNMAEEAGNPGSIIIYNYGILENRAAHAISRNMIGTTFQTTFTAESDYVFIGFGCRTAQCDSITYSDIQVEIGSTATSYVAHQEQKFVFPLETNQRLFRDGYLAYNGIHNKRTKVTLTGLENWTIVSTSSNYAYYTTLSATAIDNATIGSQYCTHFKHNLTNASSGTANYFGIDNTGKLYICVKDFNTAADWKAYLQAQYANGIPLEVEYETQTETITPYTQAQQQVYSQIKQVQMYLGTSVVYSDNETMPVLKTYYNETKLPGVINTSKIKNSGDEEGNIQIKLSNQNLAWTGWAQDFVTRINDNTKANLETKDNRNCLFFVPSAGYGNYDNKYLYKMDWKENTQYTVTFDILNSAGSSYNIEFIYTDGTSSRVAYTSPANTWVKIIDTSSANKTLKYIIVLYTSGNRYIDLDTFMILEGAYTSQTIPDYIVPQTKTITFPLQTGQKLFEGSYLARDGIHHSRGQYTFTGNEGFSKSGNTTNTSFCCFTSSITPTPKLQGRNGFLTIGEVVYASDLANYKNAFGYNTNTNHFLKIEKTIIPNWNENLTDTEKVNLFKQYLAECYANEKPIILEYELRDEQIDTYTAAQQTAYNQLMYLTIYEGYNIIYSTNEIEPTLKWSIPKSPSPDYPIEINSVGDSGSINTKVENKNLFDKNSNEIITGKWLQYTGDIANGSYIITPFIEVKPNATLKPSGIITSGTNPCYCFYDKDKTLISAIKHNNSTSYTIIVPENAYYFRDSINNDSINTYQLEYGSIATNYTPHKKQNLTLACQQPMRSIGTTKDCFFKNVVGSPYYNSELTANTWYEMHAINRYMLKDLTWGKSTSYSTNEYLCAYANNTTGIVKSGSTSNSNCFQTGTYTNTSTKDCVGIGNTGQICVKINLNNLSEDSLTALTQYFTTNNSYIDTILKTPTYLQCTQAQSNLLNSLQTYRNKTTFYSEDLVQPTLDLTYIKEPTVQAQTNETSQQTLSALYTQQIDNGRVLVSNLANGANSIKFTNPVQVNLTKQFGSGREPTKEWCDQNLTFFNCAEGGAPSPETSSLIWSVGDNVNLFDKTAIEENYVTNENTGILTALDGYYATDWIKVEPNQQYTLSGTKTAAYVWCWYDKNKNFIYSDRILLGTLRSPSTAHYLRFNGLLTELDDIKFEVGNIASPYSVYGLANIDTTINTGHEIMIKSFPLASGQKLLAGDYLTDDGIHHIRGKIVLDGTENWRLRELSEYYSFILPKPIDYLSGTQILCNMANYTNNYSNVDNSVYIGASNLLFARLKLNGNYITTLNQFKAWLAQQYTNGTPVTVEYELVEEVIESYTPAQQEWYDNFMIYTKNNTISTQATIKPYYSFTYDIDDTYNVQSTKTGEFEKLGLIFDNLEDRPRFIVDNIGETASQFIMRNPIVVDLTNEYGAGHEPNLAWCQENITDSNTCEYGTPSPKVPNEPLSVGTNPIRIETKSRNILDEGELTNWTTDTCEVEKLTGKYESRNVYKINYKNHFTGTIYYQLLKKDTDMVFSAMIKTASGDSITANKIIINKQTTSGWTAVTSINLPNSADWQKVSIPIAKSLLENAIAWRIEFAHTETTTDDAALEVCMMQLEEGFTPHDYIPYSPATVNNLIFPEPLRSLPNGTKDVMTKEGIVRAVGKYTLQSNKTGAVTFSSNPAYIIAIGQTGIYIKDDISSEAPQFYCNRFRNVDALDDIMTVHNSTIVSYREKEGIGITDTQFAICVRADLIGAIATDTSEQLKTKFNTWLDANPVILYYEKERTELEPLTELQTNTINNLTTRQLYDAWTIDGEFDTELELTYRSSIDTQTIEPWVTVSNLLNKTNLYKDNDIHTKSYIEVDNGDATKSGITSSRPVYLLNSGTTNAELNIKFDYINIVSPLTIKVIKGKFDDEGFNEIAQVSEIIINPFTSYKPFIDMYDGNSNNWYIDIDSELQEVYLKHKTDATKVLSLNKFNKNYSFLTLADCNFVDYYKVFPTIISEIEGTAIENTVFNKVVLGLSAENYRLKNATLEWKHTYL